MDLFSRLSRHLPLRVVLTLLLAFAAAQLCLRLHTPLPWMIGPLLMTAIASTLGAPTLSWTPLRNVGQMVIATALGLYFTPQVIDLVAGLWWAILLGIVWSLVLGVTQALAMEYQHAGRIEGVNRATAYFASSIGGASEMTLLAEGYGARTDMVASAHSLRVLMVALIVPFALQWSGLHGTDTSLPGARSVVWSGLPVLLGLSLLGCGLMLRLRMSNPWFIGALGVSMALTIGGVSLSAIPGWLSNAAQMVIGVSLGVRFTPAFVRAAPLWMASVALGTVAMILASAGFAWVLAWAIAHFSSAASIHPATLMLGTAPGGIAEMAITAKVLQMGVPVVTAFHVTRLAAVLILTEPVYRWWYRGRAAS